MTRTKSAEVELPEIAQNEMGSDNITVFPNPSEGIFTIDLSNLDLEEGGLLRILDIQGRQVYTGELTDRNSIDINPEMQPGSYILHIEHTGGILTQKLMLR